MVINNEVLKIAWRFAKRHAPKLLAAGAITAEGLAMWFMHKEAPVVKEKLDALPPDATRWDKFKTAAPVYIPAFTMLLLSSGCIVGSVVAGEAQVAALASLCSASEAALVAQQKKAVEVLGPEKAQELQDAVAKDLIESQPPVPSEIIATGKGDQLFFEPLSGRYFYSSRNAIEKAANEFNRVLVGEMWATCNEWFEQLGLEPVGLGETVGWNVDHFLDISWSPQAAPDDRTCWVIGYRGRPILYK